MNDGTSLSFNFKMSWQIGSSGDIMEEVSLPLLSISLLAFLHLVFDASRYTFGECAHCHVARVPPRHARGCSGLASSLILIDSVTRQEETVVQSRKIRSVIVFRTFWVRVISPIFILYVLYCTVPTLFSDFRSSTGSYTCILRPPPPMELM